MNDKIKKVMIPFVLMMVFNLGMYYLTYGHDFGEGLAPHVGILLVSGLIFGPYGAIGSVFANFLCDLIRGFGPITAIASAIAGFGVSYLAHKLWYEKYNGRQEISIPKLNNTSNMRLFLGIIIICGVLYALTHGKLFYLLYPNTIPINYIIEIRYFLNFINSSFIFGIIGIWISNKFDFTHVPKISKKEYNKKLYIILGILLILSLSITLVIDWTTPLNQNIAIMELITICLILFLYLTKPITGNIVKSKNKSIPEEIMSIFLLATLILAIFGIIISGDSELIIAFDKILPLNLNEIIISMMVFMDIILLIFLIPSIAVLRHVENKVINPIISFAGIEKFLHENEKIESEGLLELYSNYINEKTEIGTLARSYTELINFNNNYIENIHEIEGEKERIKAELDIATRIQAANLPTEPLENNDYIVNGYSKPAKEVGGDFFDYYPLDDEHLALIIGDASGKGVPAAILAMISQVMIKQHLKYTKSPSRVLFLLNNQLSEKNSETMFITVWLGIYNKTTKKLIFSNAGHNPPLIKENDEFTYLNINPGIALGLFEDFKFEDQEIILSNEIVLYTDGITDAITEEKEMYGADRLLKFFNEFESDKDPIGPLSSDINKFAKDTEQFDDMTLLYLKIKND